MDPVTTYQIKGKIAGVVWLFKYDLKGHLKSFEILEGVLNGKQMKWLFSGSNFPASETLMKTIWLQDTAIKKLFEVTIGEPDLSFETFWELYAHKLKKIDAQRAWKNLSRKDKIEALDYIKTYNNYLERKRVGKANPYRYINKRYWEDNHASIH